MPPDLAHLARLHAQSFTIPRPWSAAEIAALLDNRFVFLLSAPEGFLLGRSLAGEAELLTLAVDPDARRQGIGRRLLGAFLSHARSGGAETAFLEVSAENTAAIALYEAEGFGQVGRRRGYYEGDHGHKIDALIYQRTL